MPVYDYRATNPEKAPACCREPFEHVQPLADDPLEKCPTCGGEVLRLISAPGFTFRTTKAVLSDKNLKKHGFAKLVKDGEGRYRNTTAG